MNDCGTLKVLQLLHRGKTSRCHARRDLPHDLPCYMDEDQAPKKCPTGETFKRLVFKVDPEVAEDRWRRAQLPVCHQNELGGKPSE